MTGSWPDRRTAVVVPGDANSLDRGVSTVVAATITHALPEVDGNAGDAAARSAVVNTRVVATRRLASARATPGEALHVATHARLRARFLLTTSCEVCNE